MKRRYLILLLTLAAFYTTACNFTTKLPTETPVSVENTTTEPITQVTPAPADTRPQTNFIDSRDQAQNVNGESVVSVQPQTVSDSGSGAGASAGAYASGGYNGGYNGGYSGGQSGGASGGCCYQPPPPQCTPNYSWQFTYVIQRGDTLGRIAQAAGISVQQLAAANCIYNPNLIYPGQVIKVPCYIAPPPPPPPCCHQPPPPCCQQPYPTYPPPCCQQPYPTPLPPTGVPPQPPVIIGSALSISPYDSVNNNTFMLPPDGLITISWVASFPTAATHVVFELIPPGMGSGSPIGQDSNLGDGASILWTAVSGTQGTLRAVAYFNGGYAPQISDFYYVIAGYPPTYVPFP